MSYSPIDYNDAAPAGNLTCKCAPLPAQAVADANAHCKANPESQFCIPFQPASYLQKCEEKYARFPYPIATSCNDCQPCASAARASNGSNGANGAANGSNGSATGASNGANGASNGANGGGSPGVFNGEDKKFDIYRYNPFFSSPSEKGLSKRY